MRITYDPQADAMYIRFASKPVQVLTQRLTEDMAIDYGPDEAIAGIEILAASEYGFRPDADRTIAVEFLSPETAKPRTEERNQTTSKGRTLESSERQPPPGPITYIEELGSAVGLKAERWATATEVASTPRPLGRVP